MLSLILLLTACTSSSPSRPAPVMNLGAHAHGQFQDPNRYIVAKGDTLYSIAWLVGTDVPTLARHNGIHSPYQIYPGQVIRMDVPGISRPVYRVKSGDTLSRIAQQHSNSVADLATLNGLVPPYRIFVGQKLILNRARIEAPKAPATSRVTSRSVEGSRVANTSKPVSSRSASTLPKSRIPAGTSSDTKPGQGLAPSPGKEYAGTRVQNNAAVKSVITWQWPTKGSVISGFSLAETGNKGIDIRGERGQAVTAAAEGRVVYAGSALRGYGNLIIIKHDDNYLSAYAHNDVLRVQDKQMVKAGQHIADMGSSGATDVRLHFEIRYQGTSVDPMRYLPKR
ncbi:peptidoglycan DD-metalloendopeptidase family protein [Zobellella maritima]|uniref:peptidoglycan DD-metalloendopeptidase family protein n=1 Tax=Zobellella maritima TaxID=2059725 RepID=UPI001E3B2C18|nr:peptidoglycan DD-metalloendopeptidase family protein [Zobellella maritima]